MLTSSRAGLTRPVLLLTAVLLGSRSHGVRPPQDDARRSAQEEAIYAIVLDSLYRSRADAHWLVVGRTDPSLKPEELVPDFWEAFDTLRNLHRSTLDDFQAVNRQCGSRGAFFSWHW